jgi:hypothetical protein
MTGGGDDVKRSARVNFDKQPTNGVKIRVDSRVLLTPDTAQMAASIA